MSEDIWEVVDASVTELGTTYALARNSRVLAKWTKASSNTWHVYTPVPPQEPLAEFTTREYAEAFAREWATNRGKSHEVNAMAYRVRNDGDQIITVELPAVEIEGLVVNPRPRTVTLTPGAQVEVQLPHTIRISEA